MPSRKRERFFPFFIRSTRARACMRVYIIFINEPSLSHFPRYPEYLGIESARNGDRVFECIHFFTPFFFLGGGGESRDRTRVETLDGSVDRNRAEWVEEFEFKESDARRGTPVISGYSRSLLNGEFRHG